MIQSSWSSPNARICVMPIGSLFRSCSMVSGASRIITLLCRISESLIRRRCVQCFASRRFSMPPRSPIPTFAHAAHGHQTHRMRRPSQMLSVRPEAVIRKRNENRYILMFLESKDAAETWHTIGHRMPDIFVMPGSSASFHGKDAFQSIH